MLRWLFLLVGCLSFSTAIAYWQTAPKREAPLTRQHPKDDVNQYKPIKVLRKPIRAITNPKIVPVEESTVSPNSLVIGVEVNGEARAYSVNELTGPQREIINDTLGGTAIAATW